MLRRLWWKLFGKPRIDIVINLQITGGEIRAAAEDGRAIQRLALEGLRKAKLRGGKL